MLGFFLRAVAGRILYLALYLEAGDFPRPLTLQQERDAFAALAKGSAEARDTLIRHNLRLVAHIAKKYYGSPTAQDDLVSIGTIGLIKAVDSYDPARCARFSGYASRCIENEILMQLRRERREPPGVSLSDPLENSDGGALTFVDVLPDTFDMNLHCEQKDLLMQLQLLLPRLEPRAQRVLTLRYGLAGRTPMTQQEVAARLGISRSYVSRLESRALAQMKKMFEEERP